MYINLSDLPLDFHHLLLIWQSVLRVFFTTVCWDLYQVKQACFCKLHINFCSSNYRIYRLIFRPFKYLYSGCYPSNVHDKISLLYKVLFKAVHDRIFSLSALFTIFQILFTISKLPLDLLNSFVWVDCNDSSYLNISFEPQPIESSNLANW